MHQRARQPQAQSERERAVGLFGQLLLQHVGGRARAGVAHMQNDLVSEHTVRTYVRRAFAKLQATSRAEAVAKLYKI